MKYFVLISFIILTGCDEAARQVPTETPDYSANFETIVYDYDAYRANCEVLVDEQGEIAYQQCLGYGENIPPFFCETERAANRGDKLALFDQEIIRAQNNALNCYISFRNEDYCLAIFSNDLKFALTNCARAQYFY